MEAVDHTRSGVCQHVAKLVRELIRGPRPEVAADTQPDHNLAERVQFRQRNRNVRLIDVGSITSLIDVSPRHAENRVTTDRATAPISAGSAPPQSPSCTR